MPRARKQTGTCEACEKRAQLMAIDSGQRICPACYRELKPLRQKPLASHATLEAFARRGVTVPESLTRDDAARVWRESGLLQYVLRNIWYAEHGQPWIECPLDPETLERLALTIALNHPALSRRYAEIETQRQAAAEARFERVRQGTENLNISTHEPWPGYYACDGQLFDGLTHRRLHVWHLKPALARDESYRALVQMLRREFPGHWSATGST